MGAHEGEPRRRVSAQAKPRRALAVPRRFHLPHRAYVFGFSPEFFVESCGGVCAAVYRNRC